jgi:hypothetical protein
MKTLKLLSTAALVATLAIGGNAMASDSHRYDGSHSKGTHARTDRSERGLIGKAIHKSGARTYSAKHDDRNRSRRHYDAPKQRHGYKHDRGHGYKYGHGHKRDHKYGHAYGHRHKYAHNHFHRYDRTGLIILSNGLLLGLYD